MMDNKIGQLLRSLYDSMPLRYDLASVLVISTTYEGLWIVWVIVMVEGRNQKSAIGIDLSIWREEIGNRNRLLEIGELRCVITLLFIVARNNRRNIVRQAVQSIH